MGLIILVAMFALMWVLFILPQQRRVRQHRELIQSIGVGDEVVTAGGLFGTVTAMEDETVTLQVTPGVELKLLRGAISRRAGTDVRDAIEPAVELEPGEEEPRPERDEG